MPLFRKQKLLFKQGEPKRNVEVTGLQDVHDYCKGFFDKFPITDLKCEFHSYGKDKDFLAPDKIYIVTGVVDSTRIPLGYSNTMLE